MDKITFMDPDTNENIELYVLEKTTINEVTYLLVADEEEGESEAYIMKQIAEDEDEFSYEFVEDDVEFTAISKVFAELVEDTDFEM